MSLVVNAEYTIRCARHHTMQQCKRKKTGVQQRICWEVGHSYSIICTDSSIPISEWECVSLTQNQHGKQLQGCMLGDVVYKNIR